MDTVRGIAIVLVVLYHATTVPLETAGVPVPAALRDFTTVFAPYRMSILFLLSGLLLARSLEKRPGRYMFGKLRALVWPLLLWMVIGRVAAGDTDATEASFWYPDNWLWFLAYLIVYYVVAPLLTRIPGRWFLLVPAGCWTASAALQTGELAKLAYFAGFFFVGHCATTVAGSLRPHESRTLMALLLVVAAALSLILVARNRGLTELFVTGADAHRPLLAPVVLLGICGLVMLARRATAALSGNNGGPFRWLDYLGRHSVVLYLVHLPVQLWMSLQVADAGVTDPRIAFPLCFFGALAVGVLACALRRYRIVDALFVLPSRKPSVG